MMRAILGADVATCLAAARPDLDTSRARLLGEGYGTRAYRVPGAGGDFVVRVPKFAWAGERLEYETRVLAMLEGARFEVAVPQRPELVRNGGGAVVASVHAFVPGETVAARPVRGRAARTRMARDLGRFLSTMHSVPLDLAREAGVREQDLWADEYEPLIERALPLLPRATRAWLERRAAEFVREGGSSGAPRVLVHADIWGQNLLVDEAETLCGVIDFGDVRIADPALDFAGVLNDFPWSFLERTWGHYTHDIDADAARRTRFYIEVAPLYRVVLGGEAVGPEERRAGVRHLVARAAAASRSGERAGGLGR